MGSLVGEHQRVLPRADTLVRPYTIKNCRRLNRGRRGGARASPLSSLSGEGLGVGLDFNARISRGEAAFTAAR